jgi:rare lipoprotein A
VNRRGGAAAVLALLAFCISGCPSARVRAPQPRTGAELDLGAPNAFVEDGPRDAVAAQPAAPVGPQAVAKGVAIQRGGATYYADQLAGRSTASGEPYDPRALTAAHRTLPFGAIVDVVRRDGRRIRVRINDRGPFARGKVIDLSRRAAEAIGLIHDGTAQVTLELVSRPPRKR